MVFVSTSNLPIWIKHLCFFGSYSSVLLKNAQYRKPKPVSNPVPTCFTSLPALSVWYQHSWQAADSDGKLVNTDRDMVSSAAGQVSLGVQPRSMSAGSVRLSPSERVDPGDWVIERLVFEPADSPNKLIPTPTITNPFHPLTPDLQQRERNGGKFRGQGFSGTSQKKLLNDLISGDIHLVPAQLYTLCAELWRPAKPGWCERQNLWLWRWIKRRLCFFDWGQNLRPEVRLACWELDDPMWKEEIHLELQACNLKY